MDVEGFETVLLDPVEIPALKKSTILVELHEMYSTADCTSTIENRFQDTHEIQLVKGSKRVQPRPSSSSTRSCTPFFSNERWLGYMDEEATL